MHKFWQPIFTVILSLMTMILRVLCYVAQYFVGLEENSRAREHDWKSWDLGFVPKPYKVDLADPNTQLRPDTTGTSTPGCWSLCSLGLQGTSTYLCIADGRDGSHSAQAEQAQDLAIEHYHCMPFLISIIFLF